ncbi:MAG TPA: hypothetical protein VFE81_23165, partial [Paraburkholderia sp.]|nr:hypothetical protein [Paraburkholderia sp.]
MLLLLLFCANRPRFASFPLRRIACAAWRVARRPDGRAPRYNHSFAAAATVFAPSRRFAISARTQHFPASVCAHLRSGSIRPVNPLLDSLQPYPFEKLRALFKDI